MFRAGLAAVTLSLLLAGCAGFGTTEVSVHDLGADRRLVAMDANRRVIVASKVGDRAILCAEPSPDVGANLTRDIKASLNLSIPTKVGTVGASPSLDDSAALTVVKLIERSQALQTMRDILYRACEARMNGFIGSEAYTAVINHALVSTTALLGADMLDGKDPEHTKQILNFIQIMTAQP